MFILAMQVFRRRRVSCTHYFVGATIAMLIFATIQIVLRGVLAAISLRMVELAVEGGPLVNASLIRSRVLFAQYVVLITNK
jgi:hypothetical protein